MDEVRALFDALGIGLPASYTESDVADIVEKALHDKNPYTRGAGEGPQSG